MAAGGRGTHGRLALLPGWPGNGRASTTRRQPTGHSPNNGISSSAACALACGGCGAPVFVRVFSLFAFRVSSHSRILCLCATTARLPCRVVTATSAFSQVHFLCISATPNSSPTTRDQLIRRPSSHYPLEPAPDKVQTCPRQGQTAFKQQLSAVPIAPTNNTIR